MTQRLDDTVHVITSVPETKKPLIRPRVKKLVGVLVALDVAVYLAGAIAIRVMGS